MKPWHELTSLPVQQVNKRAQGKTCADCRYFSQCPRYDCDRGVCIERTDDWSDPYWVCADDDADECEDFEVD